MKSVVIVQARIGSSRLPGKILMKLGEKTFLEHCLDRCRLIDGIDDVVCATTDEPDAELIIDICRRRDYRWFRGSLHDVLGRFRHAADEAGADSIMRITSDCPIADPDIAGQVATLFSRGGCDLATTNIPNSWPVGLDVEMFTKSSLEEADRETTLAHDREHVTPFIRTRPIRYRLLSIPCPMEGRAHWRLTLDTEKDRQFFVELARSLPASIEQARWQDIITHLDQNPQLLAIKTPT
jgi:glutamate-1-semialdehyde 2,1-aminomutase/spore coat polysaccharide biosynthesis protein SpsF